LVKLDTFLAQALAVLIVLFAAPLFLDLAVCIAGNLRRARRPHAAPGRTIRLAVVVPAHDEETMIADTVQSLLAAGCTVKGAEREDDSAGGAGVPIYVVAHNCSDATAAVAAAAGARVVEIKNPRLAGKGAALRCGFQAAHAEGANAFLVVDADSVVSPNLIAAIKAALEAGAEVTQCRYELELPSGPFHPLARLRVLAFRGINVLRARGRAGLGFSAGLFGNGFAVTAETLARVPFSADSIVEDIEYHTRLAAAGVSVHWVEEATVWGPLAAAGAARATQEARWEGGRFHVAAHSTGRLLKAALSGEWRALEMLAEVWSLPLSRGIMALLLTAFVPLHWLHLFALGCAIITVVYVIEAALLGGEPWLDLAALAAAPLHIAWKAAVTPLVLRQSRSGAEWSRTRREARQP
jgi:cellulose synthase/poly-beta-1,6-N-acetylglucosamine synthase-like glycosyltransferase